MILLAACLFQFVPVSLGAPDFKDLSFLATELKGVQVVQLGEASHGTAEFTLLKTRLVKYLHEHLGFNVLAIEAGVMESGLAGLHRSRLSEAALMQSVLFGGMHGQEVQRVFGYLKSKPKLRLIGLDPQFSSNDVLTLVPEALRPLDANLADQAGKRLGEPYQYRGKTANADEFRRLRDAYLRWLDTMKSGLANAASTDAVRVMKAGIDGLRFYWNYEPETPPTDLFARRDEAMFRSLMAQIGKDKVIVWAHNGHIGRGLGYRILGDHLHDKFGRATFALGAVAKEGEFKQHWDGGIKPWEAEPSGIESRFPKDGDAWFCRTRDLSQGSAFEPENGGVIRFVPSARFDGMICIRKVTPPTK